MDWDKTYTDAELRAENIGVLRYILHNPFRSLPLGHRIGAELDRRGEPHWRASGPRPPEWHCFSCGFEIPSSCHDGDVCPGCHIDGMGFHP
jgi:hypothetical protein